MWTRKELKQRAREALRRNYWKIVLVAVIAMLLNGGVTAPSRFAGFGRVDSAAAVDMPETEEGEYAEESDGTEDVITVQNYNETDVMDMRDEELDGIGQQEYSLQEKLMAISVIVFVFALVIIAFSVVFAVVELLMNPFCVGVHRFMLKSVDGQAMIKEVAYGFDHSYKNIVRTLFHVDIRVLLWSILFVVPGIYKKYQYRMVSYILAEHPDIEYREALQMSKDMMDGEKWHTFVLDLSFILWHMLGMITCGIAEVFYVTPYVELTGAALYRRLEQSLTNVRVGYGEVFEGLAE